MSKVFLVDIDRCNGCRNCQIACKDEHCEQPWLPYAQAQPLTGHFWMNVTEKVRGQVPWVKITYTPQFCNHCADAPCEAACPSGAFSRRDEGLLLIDPAKCTGCKTCVEECPTSAIFFNDELGISQKCTGCAHLLDNGWDVPRCVDACATEALFYLDESEVDMDRAERFDALEGYGAKVWLYGKPKRFVAGTLFDSAADEVVIGQTVALCSEDGSVVAQTQTDDFGDFKFDQVDARAYVVKAAGLEMEIPADLTEDDLSLGDIDVHV
jgi:Fe-S-cluster-containing dehydrogenase component